MSIIFVTHDATRTGAPIQLFWIAKWFKSKGYNVSIIIIYERGDLVSKFVDEFDCIILNKKNKNKLSSLFYGKNKLNRFINKHKPNLIFTNTIISGEIIKTFLSLNVPIVSRVPEMLFTIEQYGFEKYFSPILKIASKIIIPSDFACNEISEKYPLLKSKSKVISGFIPPTIAQSEKRSKVDEKLNVLMVGNWGWRKGSDIFIDIARLIKKNHPNKDIEFTWVGLNSNTQLFNQVQYDIKKLEIDNLRIEPGTDNIQNFYKQHDIFLLTSREDPMPIVGLEAASHGLPIICFNKTGGMIDLVKHTSNSLIEYGNVDSMCNEIIKYFKMDNEAFNDISSRTKEYAIQYFSYNVIMEKIEQVLVEVSN